MFDKSVYEERKPMIQRALIMKPMWGALPSDLRRNAMKTNLSIFLLTFSLVTFLVLKIPTSVKAQGVELGEGVILTAEVVGIDRVDRTLMLLGPKGKVVAVEVSHAARNFDQIEVGDKVKIEYYESVALYLGQRGQKPEASAGLVVARAAKGALPAGVAVEAVDVSATVQAIDRPNRAVTLQGPDGKLVTTKVDKSVKAFATLKVGDSVHARYTEAVAISVEKP